ncbi:MAG: DNA mismatch repair endonuclease MutL [Vibrio sp.]
MTIQILPPRLANQIAAGEVVERPASVVKELVENSLDAGATRIDIDIEKGGAKLIRIRDNGKGIPKDELGLALSRHATSKIQSLDDLEAIMSLGFRGEALASVSSVSRLTMTSRPATQEQAWSAYAQGRDMDVKLTPAAHPVGTSVEVLDLFFNTPARRKFLRTEKTEFTHIDELLKRIALSRLDVSIRLTHNGKLIRQYRAATNQSQTEKRIAAVFGAGFIQHAVSFSQQQDNLLVKGWLTTPDGARNQADQQFCYVNGRMMRDKLINHAIRQSYEASLPADMHAAYVVYIEIDPHQVDVNVHPAKHEVRFHQARLVHDFIYQVLRSALAQAIELEAPVVTQSAYAHVSDNASLHTQENANHQTREAALSNYAPKSTSRFPQGKGSIAGEAYVPSSSSALPSASKPNRSPSKPYHGSQTPKHLDKQVGLYQALFETLPQAYQSGASLSEQAEAEQNLVDQESVALVSNQTEHCNESKSKTASQAVTESLPVSVDEMTLDLKAGLGKALSIVEQTYVLLEQARSYALMDLNQAQYWKTYAQLDVLEKGLLTRQPLLIPLQLSLQTQEKASWSEIVSALAPFGIEMELTPNHQAMRLMSVPEPLRHQNLQVIMPKLLQWLLTQDLSAPASLVDELSRWLTKACCPSKAEFTLSEAIALLADLESLYQDRGKLNQLISQDPSLMCALSFTQIVKQMKFNQA